MDSKCEKNKQTKQARNLRNSIKVVSAAYGKRICRITTLVNFVSFSIFKRQCSKYISQQVYEPTPVLFPRKPVKLVPLTAFLRVLEPTHWCGSGTRVPRVDGRPLFICDMKKKRHINKSPITIFVYRLYN